LNQKNKGMRKLVVLLLGLNFCFAYSQQNNDPTIMTVGEKKVPLSEFLFLAKKDSNVNLLNKKSLQNYVELFKTFKLKLADAESLRIQESMLFKEELASYQGQLIDSYLVDKEGERQVVRNMYELEKEMLSISHILFLLPERSLTKDTVEVYRRAEEVYKRIKAGEDFTSVGKALAAKDSAKIIYEDIDYVFPLQSFKEIVNVIYGMSPGEISRPVRSPIGFHILRVNRRIPDNVRLQVAHILIQSDPGQEQDDQTLKQVADEVYTKAKGGADWKELVYTYTRDNSTRENGGVLPYFGIGNMVLPFEQAAFALQNVGDISAPVKTRYGYHIIKLLDRTGYPPFENAELSIYQEMQQGDWKNELLKPFDEKQKIKMGYSLNQAAFDEIRKIADDYFPTDTTFYNRAHLLEKPLMHLDGKDFPQYEFADYIRLKPASNKTYSVDYLNDQYNLFVREIVSILTKKNLETDPEYINLVNEYHDGILLFEVSNTKVWEKPVEEHEALEQAWIKELNSKYKVTVNWNVLNNLKKYLK